MWQRFRQWRRRRIVAAGSLDDAQWGRALARLPFLQTLDTAEQQRLRECVLLFLHEKAIQGAAGLALDDEMRAVIAAQACILILNLDIDYYRGWVEVIVYPAEFVPTIEFVDEDGIVHTGRSALAGEAWLDGPVILSWADAAPATDGSGVNVVVHEFAHKLDMLNGDANGFPPLHADMSRERWASVFAAAYADFGRRIAADEELAIDEYAAESPAEFFAVLSEAFFEIPDVVTRLYPDVYAQLAAFYRQDPAARRARSPNGLSLRA